MTEFGTKMANFGQQIEQQMQAKGKGLQQRGQAICQQLRQLDGLEQQIQQAVPAMQPYDLIDTSQPGKQLTFKLATD
jgi:chaperonin cofactor prefoldin